MRRFLLILLVLWMPLQIAWGAAASLCQHEAGASVSHLGHHTHQHPGKSASTHGESMPDTKSALGGEDMDCGYCHIACAQPLVSALPVAVDIDASQHLVSEVRPWRSPHVPDLIERPQWSLAA